LLAIPLLTATLLSGCVMTEAEIAMGPKPPEVSVPHNIATTWESGIAYAADPTHGGAVNPGLKGRLYLFGPVVGRPVTGNGSVLVEMFDESVEGQSIKREYWEIDPRTLDRLHCRDPLIGWGYTLFLPSAQVKPEMSKLRIRTCFRPVNGAAQYTESTITLTASNGSIRQTSKPVSFTTPPPVPR
jgi:hypothetical protein